MPVVSVHIRYLRTVAPWLPQKIARRAPLDLHLPPCILQTMLARALHVLCVCVAPYPTVEMHGARVVSYASGRRKLGGCLHLAIGCVELLFVVVPPLRPF